MSFRRILIPVALIVTMLAQFLPGSVFVPRPVAAATYCDWAQFIADVTIPDGTSIAPGAAFVKTWRLKNIGTCTWQMTSYKLFFFSGDMMGSPSEVPFPSSVAPGGTIDLTVNLTAPTVAGHYRGYYKLRNASSAIFGVGPAANSFFFVDIVVGSAYTTAYDFVYNYCSATWRSGAGALPCPGTDGNPNGFVVKMDSPQLENGVFDTSPGLLIAPNNTPGGYIQAVFPAFTVQAGDRFQSLVNCYYGASSCYVLFRLQYQIGSGPIQTFWSFKERYEGLFYRVNLDLSSLAGQSVKFILSMSDVSGRGTPLGDRALWGGTRIARGGPSGPAPTMPPSSACDRADFIADVTIPDGTVLAAGTPFVKTWRLKNNGVCTWTTAYSLFFVSGDLMGAATPKYLTSNVVPGATIDLSVNMTAPSTTGHYRGYWRLRNASGVPFGVGTGGAYAFFVDINVTGTYTTVYDFTTNACSAIWTSGAGVLPCYGTDGNPMGFVLNMPSPQMEDSTIGAPGLMTFPQNVTDGFIQGEYPAFSVQNGDHFQATVNCQYLASTCDVNFRLDYRIGAGPLQNFKMVHEVYDGHYYRVDSDLSLLAGQSVNFILTVQANGLPTGDRAIWSAPRIARLVAPPPPGPTATFGPGADLKVTVTDGTSNYIPGGSTTYTVVVSNNGPLTVTGATFTDVWPSQLTGWTVTCVADPGAYCTPGPIAPAPGVNITDSSVKIDPLKKVTYTIIAAIGVGATGTLTNTVTITPPAGVPDPVPTNNSASDIDAPPYADLTVTMTDGVSLYTPSGTVTYTAVVFNNGPVDVIDAVFNASIPSESAPGTQVSGWTVTCVADPGAVCAGGASIPFSDTPDIPAGKKVTYTIVATIAAAATGSLTVSTAIVAPVNPPAPATITDPVPSNNTASDTNLPPSADMMVTITDYVSTYIPGGTNTYVVVVTNNGPSDVIPAAAPADGARFTAWKPTQISSWTITCTPDLGATCTGSGGSIALDFNDQNMTIPAGKKVTYTIVATILNPTSGAMTVTVYIATPASLPDPVSGNNSASDTDT